MFNAFVSTCALTFCKTHGHNNTCRFDTEGFVSATSFCGAVASPSVFTNSLINRTGKWVLEIWSEAQKYYWVVASRRILLWFWFSLFLYYLPNFWYIHIFLPTFSSKKSEFLSFSCGDIFLRRWEFCLFYI